MASVKEYWIVLGMEKKVEVYRSPERGRYQQRTMLSGDDRLECASLPTLRLRIADLFVSC